MRVWIVTIGEPLPTDPGGQRLHRAGILSKMLAERGHDVLWWSASFDHVAKRRRFAESTRLSVTASLTIWCLSGRPYRGNVSIARLVNHFEVAREFDRLAPDEVTPDIILAAMPSIELAHRAVAYGRRRGIPCLLDIRDLWPDIWVEAFPAFMRGLARSALWPYDRMLRSAITDAAAVIGFTDGAVQWALAKTGRTRTANDRAIPFGYEATPPPSDDIAAAERYWDDLGVPAEGGFVACFIGSMSRRLPLARLVDAASLVPPDRRREIRFVLCGDGAARPDLQARAAGLEFVLLPGHANRAQIWTLLRRAAIGLLPYPRSIDFLRSIPNKAVEYLSGGLPIVTSMQGEMTALIARYGCGVALEEETPEALASAILRLADERHELNELRTRAEAAFADLTAEAVYGRLIEHLARLAAAGSAASPIRRALPNFEPQRSPRLRWRWGSS